MELVKHYWNRQWGRLAKRDIHVYKTGDQYRVVWDADRDHGEKLVATEAEAIRAVDSLTRSAPGDWRDITEAHRPSTSPMAVPAAD